MCQQFWKLVGSRQSYCNNKGADFWPTLHCNSCIFVFLVLLSLWRALWQSKKWSLCQRPINQSINQSISQWEFLKWLKYQSYQVRAVFVGGFNPMWWCEMANFSTELQKTAREVSIIISNGCILPRFMAVQLTFLPDSWYASDPPTDIRQIQPYTTSTAVIGQKVHYWLPRCHYCL